MYECSQYEIIRLGPPSNMTCQFANAVLDIAFCRFNKKVLCRLYLSVDQFSLLSFTAHVSIYLLDLMFLIECVHEMVDITASL